MPDIRVDKRNIELIKNEKYRQYDMYKVTMPKGSTYEGYHFLISPRNFYNQAKMKTPQFIFSVSDDYTFELIKSEREEGKRYSRPKVPAQEILEELTLGADKDGEIWLANVTTYSERGIFNTHFLSLGIKANKWFYPVYSKTLEIIGTRKRIDAYGLVLIKEMNESDIARYQKYLQVDKSSILALEERKSRKSDLENYLKYSKSNDNAEITNAENVLLDLLTAEFEKAKAARVNVLSEFEDFIGYQEKQWNEEKQHKTIETEEIEDER